MNTIEIEKTVERLRHLRHFLGVFPRDKLPHISDRPACFIANTDPSFKPGQHWVALFFDRRVEYFDSYGLEPLEEFKIYKPDWYNTYCLQRLDTAVCGEYCIYFLSCRSLGIEPDRIVSKLLKRSDSDNLVKQFVDRVRPRRVIASHQCCAARGKNENS